MKNNNESSGNNLDYERIFALSGYFFTNRYILREGYIRNLVEERVVDADGNPVP